MGQLQMSGDEREAFLADLHVGILSIERAEGPPLTVPIWYDYEPGGELWFFTNASSLKGRLLTAAGRFSLCAQQEETPYRYVSVEGDCTSRPSDVEGDLRPMARRYLGTEMGDLYIENNTHGDQAILVSMFPERWFTVDYAKSPREELN